MRNRLFKFNSDVDNKHKISIADFLREAEDEKKGEAFLARMQARLNRDADEAPRAARVVAEYRRANDVVEDELPPHLARVFANVNRVDAAPAGENPVVAASVDENRVAAAPVDAAPAGADLVDDAEPADENLVDADFSGARRAPRG